MFWGGLYGEEVEDFVMCSHMGMWRRVIPSGVVGMYGGVMDLMWDSPSICVASSLEHFISMKLHVWVKRFLIFRVQYVGLTCKDSMWGFRFS